MHRGEHAGAHHEGAEQAQGEGEDGEQQHAVAVSAALLADDESMQQGGAEQPGQQGGIFHRIPEPPATPTELVIGPPGAEQDASGEKHPGAQCPGPAPVGHGAVQPARVQRRHGEGEVDCKAHVAEIEQGRVNDEAYVLQHGIEIASLQGPRELPVKRAGEDKGIESKQPHYQPHDGEHPGTDQRVDPLRAERHQGAPERQRKDEEEHGAFMAAPDRRQLEAHGQGAVGVLSHIADGKIILGKAAGEQQQSSPQQGGIEQCQRLGTGEQRGRCQPQAQPGQGTLHQRERRCQQQ